MKSLGVSEIGAMLAGEIDHETALAMLQQSTRRFAKRQMTWFRNQVPDWSMFEDTPAALAHIKCALG